MTITQGKPGHRVKAASKRSKTFVESLTGFLFMVVMFPIWLLGYILKWFAHNIDMISMVLLAAFSFGWSVENYFSLFGFDDLAGSLGKVIIGFFTFKLDWGLAIGVITATFIATLIQSVEYQAAKERDAKKRNEEIDGHEPNGWIIAGGYLFYFVEVLVVLKTIGSRINSDWAYLPLALLIGAISVWGFEYGVGWIEKHGHK